MKDADNNVLNSLHKVIEPFRNIVRAPRALWGVNVAYFLEGMCYFGILTLMAIHFNRDVGLSDIEAGPVVGFFTGGITLAMFFFGELADRWGIRRALVLSLLLMIGGRIFLSASNIAGGWGFGSPMFYVSIGGLLLVVLGYGMYMPASYAAVRQFTTEKNAAMGYAMLYALMNLGAFLPGLISPPLRAAFGIRSVFWVYTALTLLSLLSVLVIMTRKSVLNITSHNTVEPEKKQKQPFHLATWLREHPLRDSRFSFFIFILIPVQTLFAHQWLTMPQYVERSFPGWVSENMELFVNINPLLIFVLTPVVAALTHKVDVYKMMIIGTFVMAVPTLFLALGANVTLLFAYILLTSLGEAMWQPRFLQLAAELAPEGKTGLYMGIAQFPWFLTKLLTSLYSGYMLSLYCPETGVRNSEFLWLLYGLIALVSPVALVLARGWMAGKLKTSGQMEDE